MADKAEDNGGGQESGGWQAATPTSLSDWTGQSHRQSVLIALLIPVSIWAIGRLSIGWALMACVVLLVAVFVVYLQPGFLRTGCIGLATFILTVAIVMPHFIKPHGSHAGPHLKQNLHAIQLAVERYAVDHNGEYPSDITAVIGEGRYMEAFPENPYLEEALSKARVNTMAPKWKSMLPMHTVSLRSTNTPGSFAYIPRFETDDSGNERVVGYQLFAFGDRITKKYDKVDTPKEPLASDCIVITLESGLDTKKVDPKWQTEGQSQHTEYTGADSPAR